MRRVLERCARHCGLPRGVAWAALLLLAGLVLGCASDGGGGPRPLPVQMREISTRFFEDLSRSGSTAQAYFTLFLPEGTVNPRYLLVFEKETEKALREASSSIGMHYNASADRVFFLSRHKAEGWTTPAGADQAADALAQEFRRGTREGWTILHAFWGQFNRLLIGDAAWIQNLPDSVRADLSHPLRYVVRVGVALESSPNMTTYIHGIQLELIEVGSERCVFSGRYPLILSYSLI